MLLQDDVAARSHGNLSVDKVKARQGHGLAQNGRDGMSFRIVDRYVPREGGSPETRDLDEEVAPSSISHDRMTGKYPRQRGSIDIKRHVSHAVEIGSQRPKAVVPGTVETRGVALLLQERG